MIGKIFSWIGGLVVLLIVIGIVVGGSDKTPSITTSTIADTPSATASTETMPVEETLVKTPAQTIGHIGERVELAGVALTALKVKRQSSVNEFLTPDEGNIYLAVEVIIENTAKEKAPYNPFYFKLKDQDGFEYTTSFAGVEPDLKSGELRTGGKARGNVTFEVKKTAKGLVMTYEPLVILGGYEPIEIKLDQ
jgi:Domain of unknown function (DUF4352)